MKTIDMDSLTNSVFMAMDREFRKNKMGGAFHRHAQGNRNLLQGMCAMIVADYLSMEGKFGENPPATVQAPKRSLRRVA
jgi:hypothetical protein